jgi:hypothetical protein
VAIIFLYSACITPSLATAVIRIPNTCSNVP